MKISELKMIAVDELKPAEYNPRKKLKPGDKEFEKIKNSIIEFGFADPLVVNKDMTIIGGHQRLAAAVDIGYTEVPCAVVNLSKAKEKALNIALNKITGEWDEKLLADLIVDLQNEDFNIDFTGFEAPEVEQLMSKVHNKDVTEDNFNVDEELKNPAVAKLGDVWLLGRHRLVCGDSTQAETLELLMDGKKANLVVTDPPYNVGIEEKAGDIENDDMDEKSFYNFLYSSFVNMEQSMEDDASIYVFHSDKHGLTFRLAFRDAGFYFSECCIWKKHHFVRGRSPYHWIHEPILFGWKIVGKHKWYTDRKQTTVWEYDKPASSESHPTMKPVALMAYPIRNSSMSNCIVLDPFCGSGSTLIACEETNRICYAVELDVKFVDVIVKRYIEYVGGSDSVFLLRDGKKVSYAEVGECKC